MPFSDVQLKLVRDLVVLDLEPPLPDFDRNVIFVEPRQIPPERFREAVEAVAGIRAGRLSKKDQRQIREWMETHGLIKVWPSDELQEAMKDAEGKRREAIDYFTAEAAEPFFFPRVFFRDEKEKMVADFMSESGGNTPPQPISCLQRMFERYVAKGDYGRAKRTAGYLSEMARVFKQHQIEYETWTILLELRRQGRCDPKHWQWFLRLETADTAEIDVYLNIMRGEALMRIGPENRRKGARLIVEALIERASGAELASRLESTNIEHGDYLGWHAIFNETARQVGDDNPALARTFQNRADGEMAFYRFLASLDLGDADPVTRGDLMMERLARDTSGRYDILLFELSQVWERILRSSVFWASKGILLRLAEVRFGASGWDRNVSLENYLVKTLLDMSDNESSERVDEYDRMREVTYDIDRKVEELRGKKKTGDFETITEAAKAMAAKKSHSARGVPILRYAARFGPAGRMVGSTSRGLRAANMALRIRGGR